LPRGRTGLADELDRLGRSVVPAAARSPGCRSEPGAVTASARKRAERTNHLADSRNRPQQSRFGNQLVGEVRAMFTALSTTAAIGAVAVLVLMAASSVLPDLVERVQSKRNERRT